MGALEDSGGRSRTWLAVSRFWSSTRGSSADRLADRQGLLAAA